MKISLDYQVEKIYHNSAFSMALYIGYLSSRMMDFYDLAWKNEVFSIQEYNGSLDATLSFPRNWDGLLAVVRDNCLCSEQLETYQRKAQYVFDEVDQTLIGEGRISNVLSYMKIVYTPQDTPVPAVTTACWSERGTVYSCEDRAAFIQNGGELIDFLASSEYSDIESYFIEEYEIEDNQIAFATLLFDAKIGKKKITHEELSHFLEQCRNPQMVYAAITNYGVCGSQ